MRSLEKLLASAIVLLALIVSVTGPGLLGFAGLVISTGDAMYVQEASAGEVEPSVSFIQVGLTGDIETELVVAELEEEEVIILGTSTGVYVLCPESEESLQMFIATPGSVQDIVVHDVTGDDTKDLVVATDDSYFPNVRCYDSSTGVKVWEFAPRMEVFDEDILWTEMQTQTFDLATIEDVDGDGCSDIAVTSGYSLYLIGGRTGEEIWGYETEDNLWRVAVLPDIDGDGVQDVAAGSQTGFMYVVSGKAGEKVWVERIAEECTVTTSEGKKYCTVARSVWDIVPVEIGDAKKALVSAEDGMVRLIGLTDGQVDWTSEAMIEYTSGALYNYYGERNKNKRPSSPGDDHFFNLRLLQVDDVNDDGISEVLASAHGDAGDGALSLIDVASEKELWKLAALDLTSIANVEIVNLDGQEAVFGPGSGAEGAGLIALDDGQSLDSLQISLASTSNSSDQYWVKRFGEDKFLLVSDSQDILCISVGSTAEAEWNYPRLTDAIVETGEFTGDSTTDLLVRSQDNQYQEDWYTSRILYVVDGASGEAAWSYDMPYDEFAASSGIADVKVTDDLDGDGNQDIIGYVRLSAEDENSEDEYRLRVFSGSGDDGDYDMLLNQPVVNHTYYGICQLLYDANEAGELEDVVEEMFNKGVEGAYYDAYRELYGYDWNAQPNEAPFLKAQVDDFVEQILNDRPEGYVTDWLDDDSFWDDLESNLADEGREQSRNIGKQIGFLDVLDIPEMGGLVLVAGNDRDVFFLHPTTGDLLLAMTTDTWCYEDPFLNVQPPESWRTSIRSLLAMDDINDDGSDDVLLCHHGEGNRVSVSTVEIEYWHVSFEVSWEVESGENEWINEDAISLIEDTDGDGNREVFFRRDREDESPLWTLTSSATGETLLETDKIGWGGNDRTLDWASADFNSDGYADHILYRTWSDDYDNPRVRVISGNGGESLWQYDFNSSHLFWELGLDDLQPIIMPATSVSDMNGDGTSDLALIRCQADQAGTELLIYDITDNASDGEPLKEVVIEESGEWEENWHPGGVIVEEVGDYTGDGHDEVAVVALLGERDEEEVRLLVVDLVEEEVVVDFYMMGSQLIEMGNDELVFVGLTGGVYFLDVVHSFSITSPTEGSSGSSPVTFGWTGAGSGSFIQIYIDDVLVAQTNESEIAVEVAKGEHEVKIRCVDENGRGVWDTTSFAVSKSETLIVLAFVLFFILVLIALAMVFHVNPMRIFTKLRPKKRLVED